MMDTEIFLREFAPLASGPGGIQQLRGLVLQLAVRGRLVPQLTSDGHAADVAARALKEVPEKIKTLLTDALQPHIIPANWVWATLGAISNYGESEKIEPGTLQDPEFWVLELEDVEKTTSRLIARVPFSERNFRSSKNRFRKGQVLYGKLRPYLDKVLVADRDGCCTTEIVPFSVLGGIDPHFIRWCMKTPDFIAYADGSTYGMNLPRMGTKSAIAAPIPLPPIAEQKRIVAKVDELMALCDELETQQGEDIRLKRATSASALHHLTEAKTPEETAERWSLLVSGFDDLFDDLETIKALRAIIRILGVQGKLGTQVQSDEPTAIFLDRVGRLPPPARYAKRSKEKIPGCCGLSINLPSLPVPSAWEWVPLVEVAKIESGHTPSRSRPDWWGGDIPWMGLVDARHHDEGTIYDTIQKTNPNGIANSAARVLPAGTVCFSRTASVGYVVIMGKPMATSQDFVNWVPTDAVTSEWLQLVMVAERGSIDKFSKGAVHQTIYYPAWLSMHIALPPLAEQKRIVATVNELMSLCDRLEDQVRKGEQLNAALMASLVHTITETDPDGGGAAELVGFTEEANAVAAHKPSIENSPETPETRGVYTPLTPESEVRPRRDRPSSVDTKFQEAVLVGAIVKAFFDAGGEPIGNFRLQKAVYFARRHNGEHVGQMEYLKKAAGPYNPSMKYSGGIAIARQKSWLREARGRFGFGHVPGPAADEMNDWLTKYGYDDPARWVAEHFRFKKNEEWETLATVDYAMEHLQSMGIEADAEQVLQYIRADDEWRPKIEKLGLTEMSVGTTMLEVQALFGFDGEVGSE